MSNSAIIEKPKSRAPIPLVVVGLNFGQHIVKTLVRDRNGESEHVRLAGLCDLDHNKARAMAAEFGGLPVYDSLDEVLADEGIGAVGLMTGPAGRAGLIRKIIRAGKDVMTTKPFETDPKAAEEVLIEAGKRQRVVHLNSPRPGVSQFMGQVAVWREELDLGMPVGARAETWAHYREAADGSWKDDPATCPAAPIFRLGIYPLNDLVQLFGRARRVSVFGSRLFTGRPTLDNAQLSIEFESGALANIYASFCVRDGDQYRKGMTVNFERGTVYRSVGIRRLENGAEMGVVVNDGDWRPRQVAAECVVGSSSGYDWAGFAAAVHRAENAPGCEIDHIVEPLRIIRAMSESERTGQVVEVAHE